MATLEQRGSWFLVSFASTGSERYAQTLNTTNATVARNLKGGIQERVPGEIEMGIKDDHDFFLPESPGLLLAHFR